MGHPTVTHKSVLTLYLPQGRSNPLAISDLGDSVLPGPLSFDNSLYPAVRDGWRPTSETRLSSGCAGSRTLWSWPLSLSPRTRPNQALDARYNLPGSRSRNVLLVIVVSNSWSDLRGLLRRWRLDNSTPFRVRNETPIGFCFSPIRLGSADVLRRSFRLDGEGLYLMLSVSCDEGGKIQSGLDPPKPLAAQQTAMRYPPLPR